MLLALRWPTRVVCEVAGTSKEDLRRWAREGLIDPVEVPGHGYGGRVHIWDWRSVRRVWMLARLNGRTHDLWAAVEELDRHGSGVLVALPHHGPVTAGHRDLAEPCSRCGVVDLDEMRVQLEAGLTRTNAHAA